MKPARQPNPYSASGPPVTGKSTGKQIRADIEIASSSLHFHLTKKITIGSQVMDISDVVWKSRDISHAISLTGYTLWLSGNLECTLFYTRKNRPDLFQQAIPVPWKQAVTLEYTHPPVLPAENIKREYQYSRDGETDFLYEQEIFFNEQPSLSIDALRLITSYKFPSLSAASFLILDSFIEIKYKIYQKQIITL